MWIQLLTHKSLDTEGVQRGYHPGDWVDIGKQTALQWIESGEARTLQPLNIGVAEDCGVLLTKGDTVVRGQLRKVGSDLKISEGPASLPYPRTLILTPPVYPVLSLLKVGFDLVQRWELAVPLLAGYPTAETVGSPKERKRTQEIVRDLRVPLYDTRVIFARQCPATERVLVDWAGECAAGGHPGLAWLRAMYRQKPVLLALPPEWVKE